MTYGVDKAEVMIERERTKEIHDIVFEPALTHGKPQQMKLTNMFKAVGKNVNQIQRNKK